MSIKKFKARVIFFAYVFIFTSILLLPKAYAWPWNSSAQASYVYNETDNARINWTEGYVEAIGQAVAPKGQERTAQGKLLAKRGAIVDLQRNLLEFISGVNIDATSVIDDFMANDRVKTQVYGVIKNVIVEKADWKKGVYTVIGKVKLPEVRIVILPLIEKKSVPVAKKQSQKQAFDYTGLIVDARHLPLVPAMTFRIVNEKGEEIYGVNRVEQQIFLSSGLCEYHSNMEWAKGRDKVASKPLIVKATKLISPSNVDIVISDKDAQKILNNKVNYLNKCKVLIIKQ